VHFSRGISWVCVVTPCWNSTAGDRSRSSQSAKLERNVGPLRVSRLIADGSDHDPRACKHGAHHRETRSRLLRAFYRAANHLRRLRFLLRRLHVTDRVRCAILPRRAASRRRLRGHRSLVTRYIMEESRSDYRWKRDNLGPPSRAIFVFRARARARLRLPPRSVSRSLGSKLSWQSRRNFIRKSDYTNAITSRNIASKALGARGKTRRG